MNDRILIISDTHLGLPGGGVASPAMLRPLWQRTGHLVINGDVAEIHHPRLRAQAARHVLRLHELCEKDNADLTLISGNHDAYLTDLRHLQLAAGRVLVTHGDALHPAVAPWSPLASQLKVQVNEALSKLAPDTREQLSARLEAVQYVAQQHLSEHADRICPNLLALLLRPWLVLKVWQYWRTVPTLAAQFAQQHAPQARFVVFGHSHRQGVWQVGRHVVINTGCFSFPGRPYAVELDDVHLRVWPVCQRDGLYHLAPQPVGDYELCEPQVAAA